MYYIEGAGAILQVTLMRKGKLEKGVQGLLLGVAVFALAVGGAQTVLAVTSSSENYQLTESQFNGGTVSEGCSESYCAQASIGDMSRTTGKSSAAFDPKPDDDPVLEVIVDPGESNLGVLTTEHTATKTVIVRVRNNLSEGYIVQLVGNAPKYGNHTLKTSKTPTASKPGEEQFGVNVVANTTPLIGAAPAQVPGGQGIFGSASDGYNTSNMFKYESGDIIARSTTPQGRTDYTISMIVNISNATPAGKYAGDFAALVIPTY